MKKARRMDSLSSGVFNDMDEKKRIFEAKGIEVINLGVGSPDLPPAPHIMEAMQSAVGNPINYSYSLGGIPRLYDAVAGWYSRRFNVDLDPENEILALMGSQDGLAHLAMAYIDPGDTALIPDPGYPIYSFSILMAQGEIHPMPLLASNKFLPDLSAIPQDIAKKSKMLWINYPNNPTAASADREFFKSVVEFARKYDILVCHDVAYAELAYDNFKPMSFLEIDGAKDVGVEFYSLSKTYNMAGCRLGFMAGNREVISNLSLIKSNIDYGVFFAVQEAGIAALSGPQDCVAETAGIYQRRRDVLVDGLAEIGWNIPKPSASMFIWAPLPPGYTASHVFVSDLLERAGVIVIPGAAFGRQGDGYVRIAMVKEEALLAEAVQRIRRNFNFKKDY
jgi:LL-diaminopimelate aminotransferase